MLVILQLLIVVNEFEFYEMKVNEDGTTSPTILCSFNKMQTLQLETFLSQIERDWTIE